jgi:hypothetical protein
MTEDERRLLMIASLYDMLRINAKQLYTRKKAVHHRLQQMADDAQRIIEHLDEVAIWPDESS